MRARQLTESHTILCESPCHARKSSEAIFKKFCDNSFAQLWLRSIVDQSPYDELSLHGVAEQLGQ